ncbi:MAG: hypothetical protein ACRDDZ_03230 [Marinifilaceae bacterium]
MRNFKYLLLFVIISIVSSCKNHSAVIDGNKITFQGNAAKYLYVLPEKYMIQQINDADIYISVLFNINNVMNPDSCMVLCWNPTMQLQDSKGQDIYKGNLVFAKEDQFNIFNEFIKKPVNSQQYFTFANFELPNNERTTIFESTTQAVIKGIDIVPLHNPMNWEIIINKYEEYVNLLSLQLTAGDKAKLDALNLRNINQLISVVHKLRDKVNEGITANQFTAEQLEQVNAVNANLQQCAEKAQQLDPVIVI